ncbi:MAG: SH3 domain-containing protein [Anaerolineae bacterium]|nr:SH3 domain-containing protein [Anaerolineae bacterium]
MRQTPVRLPYLLIGALVALLIGALIAAPAQITQAQTTTTTAIPTSTPVFTPTATLPILVVTPASGCYAPLQLRIGGLVVVTGGVNVRATPSVSGVLLNYFAEEKLVRLIDGPVCANGYNWWRVAGVGEPGWVIEGTPGRYLVEQVPDPETSGCFPAREGIAVGGQVRAITGSRVRDAADPGALVITVAPPGTLMTVLEGPRCWNGLNWYRVRTRYQVTETLIEGWVGEGYPGEYWIEGGVGAASTPLPCAHPLSWRAGTRAAVSYGDGVPRRLRAEPNVSGALVLELLDGVAFEVIDGTAVCSGGYNWWHVRILTTGITGWIAEGTPGRYWVELIAR